MAEITEICRDDQHKPAQLNHSLWLMVGSSALLLQVTGSFSHMQYPEKVALGPKTYERRLVGNEGYQKVLVFTDCCESWMWFTSKEGKAREIGRKKWKEQEAGELSQMLTKFLYCVCFGCSCKYVPLRLWRTTWALSVEYPTSVAAWFNNKEVLNCLKMVTKPLKFTGILQIR